MAESGLKFDLSLHLENLVPGVVSAFALGKLLTDDASSKLLLGGPFETILKSEFGSAVLFLCIAYLVGAVSILLSRLVVDSLSWVFFRPVAFGWLVGKRLKHRNGDKDVPFYDRLRVYNATLSNAYKEGSKDRITEIDRRRERARLLRATLVPVSLLLVAAKSPAIWCQLGGLTLLITALYAYGEVAVFQEADLCPD